MTFRSEIDALAKRGDVLRSLALTGGAIAGLLLALAFLVAPPAPGPYVFDDVQVHLDAVQAFKRAGIDVSESAQKHVLGVPLAQLDALVALVGAGLFLTALADLIRLRWRPGLRMLAIWLGVSVSAHALTFSTPFYTADANQCGVRDARPTAAQLATNPVARDLLRLWEDRQGRANALKAEITSARPGRPAAETAALRYTAAQLAYLAGDPAQMSEALDTVGTTFHPTTDADYRIRVMRDYAESRGVHAASDAYRPATGLDFGLARALSRLLLGLGVLAAASALGLLQLSRSVRGRVERLRGLLAPSRAPSTVGLQRFSSSRS